MMRDQGIRSTVQRRIVKNGAVVRVHQAEFCFAEMRHLLQYDAEDITQICARTYNPQDFRRRFLLITRSRKLALNAREVYFQGHSRLLVCRTGTALRFDAAASATLRRILEFPHNSSGSLTVARAPNPIIMVPRKEDSPFSSERSGRRASKCSQ